MESVEGEVLAHILTLWFARFVRFVCQCPYLSSLLHSLVKWRLQ